MKEKKIIAYFPRSHFWKIWEKRQISVILTETNKKVTSQNFYKSGILQREYLKWKNGNLVEKLYFPDGQLRERTSVSGHRIRQIHRDENGNMLLDKRVNERTQIETHYHPNGKLKIRHDRKTGEYEEWAPNGILKKKGRWLNRSGGIAELSNSFAGFETGNMRVKQKDEQRQEYNEAIDAINILPATPGRKIAKEVLVKEYKKALYKTRD